VAVIRESIHESAAGESSLPGWNFPSAMEIHSPLYTISSCIIPPKKTDFPSKLFIINVRVLSPVCMSLKCDFKLFVCRRETRIPAIYYIYKFILGLI
jgi:hypothetical protein